MGSLTEMLSGYEIPEVAEIATIFDSTRLDKVSETLLNRLREKNLPIEPGQRIAITGGSRGIADYVTLMRTAVAYIKEKKGIPPSGMFPPERRKKKEDTILLPGGKEE